MPEGDVLVETREQQETPEQRHAREVDKAMHGVKKPEKPADDDEFSEDWGDLVDSFHESDLKTVEKSLNLKLEPFDKHGNEHKNYVSEDDSTIVKINNIPLDDNERLEKEGQFVILNTLYPKFFPKTETFKIVEGEGAEQREITGEVVEKLKEHPQYREALETGNTEILDRIVAHPFSEVLDDCDRLGIPLRQSFDGTDPDNYFVDPDGYQPFIDDPRLGTKLLAAKDNILKDMAAHADKYSIDDQTKIARAFVGLGVVDQRRKHEEASKASGGKIVLDPESQKIADEARAARITQMIEQEQEREKGIINTA